METQNLIVGEIYWTNLSQPGGPVQLLEIVPRYGVGLREIRTVVRIKHVADHPYGYSNGTVGYYMVDELRELTPEEREQLGL